MKVVLIDDNEMDIFVNQKLLEKGAFDIDITTFISPECGLDHIHSNKVDIALIDNQMPGFTGLKFVQSIKKEASQYPRIIILSASINPEDVISFKNYNPNIELWEKPLDIKLFSDLLASVR